MYLIPLADIRLADNRQRRFFDPMKIVDLADSITELDLLNPITLEADSNTLVSGERRLKAIDIIYSRGDTFSFNGESVPPGMVPYTTLTAREASEYYAAELAENTVREDLTWAEQVSAEAALHEYRASRNPEQTLTDTAREIHGDETNKSDITSLSQSVNLAAHLTDPEISKAKSKKEAVKVLQSKLKAEHHKKLAANFKISKKETSHTLEQTDAIAFLEALPAETVDVYCTDPPYGIDAHGFGTQAKVSHEYDDSHEMWENTMERFAQESYRAAKSQAHAYIFCDPTLFSQLAGYFSDAGWEVWKTPFVWYKGTVGMLPHPEHGPRRSYETILYAIKGGKPITAVYLDTITNIPGVRNPRHAAEKPAALYANLLRRSVTPGDTVCDPFCGSGPIFPAANTLSCVALGCDLAPVNVGLASGRLEETLDEEEEA